MERFNGVQSQPGSQDFGFSPTVNATIQANFQGTTQDFQRGFEGLSPHISQHGLDPNLLASQYPEDTAHLVQAYLMHGDDINRAPDPLHRATELGNAGQVQSMITFMPMNGGDDQSS
jgi:hypothetical protein